MFRNTRFPGRASASKRNSTRSGGSLFSKHHSTFASDEGADVHINAAWLSPLLSTLFPPGVVGAERRTAGDPMLLLAGEALCLGQVAPRRVQEFAAGRVCARRALIEFGFSGKPLLMNSDRQPQWPNAVVGSISHTVGMCGAVVASQRHFRGIGLDMETIDMVTQEIWPYICTPEELTTLSGLHEPGRSRYAALIFSSKESFYKCQCRTIQQWLEFGDVTLQLPPNGDHAGSFTLQPGKRIVVADPGVRPFSGRFEFRGNHVVTGMAIAAM